MSLRTPRGGSGNNANGRVGVGDTTTRTTPTQIGALTTWARVIASYDHSCARKTDNTLWCWGNNLDGQLGVGDTTQRLSPTQVTGTTWNSFSTNGSATCATQTDGTLWCWGDNTYG